MLKRGVPTPSDVQKFVRCIGVDIRTRANLKLSLNPKISCPDPISKIFLLDALMCDDLDTARQYVPFVKNCLIPQNDDLHSLIAGFNHATKRAFRPPTFAFDVLGDLLTKLLQLPEDRGEDQGEDKNRLSQYRSLLADVLWESGKYNESISVGEKLVDQLERAVPRERARPIWHLAATSNAGSDQSDKITVSARIACVAPKQKGCHRISTIRLHDRGSSTSLAAESWWQRRVGR
jgi:hypothetical protein